MAVTADQIEATAREYAAKMVADEREACARLAQNVGMFSDCECLGPMDMDTGARECSMERCGGSCECAAKIEHGDEIAALIRARSNSK